MSDKKEKTMRFEEAFGQLESIVAQLEEGEIPLEKSLELFEEGMILFSRCNQKLSSVENRLQQLIENANGDLELHDFE